VPSIAKTFFTSCDATRMNAPAESASNGVKGLTTLGPGVPRKGRGIFCEVDMNRFSQTCLVAIVVLLLAIATQRAFFAQSVRDAGPHQFNYRIVVCDLEQAARPYLADHPVSDSAMDVFKKVLNGDGANGWEVVSMTPVNKAGTTTQIVFVLRK
jgi:hypothetical protein